MYVKVNEKLLQLAREPTSLNYGEIILLAYICSLAEDGECYMSNKYIADTLCTSERTIKRWIQELRTKELLEVYYDEVKGKERRIMVPKLAL